MFNKDSGLVKAWVNLIMDSKLDKQQAVMETKMDELTREVREHNNFAKRMPVVEEQIKVIKSPH
ncbi:MAG: hypothetical protein V8R40_07015 [Dysosmobacter sp.]